MGWAYGKNEGRVERIHGFGWDPEGKKTIHMTYAYMGA